MKLVKTVLNYWHMPEWINTYFYRLTYKLAQRNRIISNSVKLFYIPALLLLISCQSDQAKLAELNRLGAVVADDSYTALIGREVMQAGGNAADAMVAMVLLSGVSNPGRAGMAASGQCLIYTPASGQVLQLDFNPAAIRNPNATNGEINNDRILYGLHGMLALHARFGIFALAELFAPAEVAARGGVLIGDSLLSDLNHAQPQIAADPEASKYFLLQGELPAKATLLRRVPAALSIRRLAEASKTFADPVDLGGDQLAPAAVSQSLLYRQMAEQVKQIRQNQSALFTDDWSEANLAVHWRALAPRLQLTGWDFFTSQPPGGGLQALKLLRQYIGQAASSEWRIDIATRLRLQQQTIQQWSALLTQYAVAEIDQEAIDSFWHQAISPATTERNAPSEQVAVIKNELLDAARSVPVYKMVAVDYFGLAVSCSLSLGPPFGQGRLDPEYHVYHGQFTRNLLNEFNQIVVIDSRQNKFIAGLTAGNWHGGVILPEVLAAIILDGNNLYEAIAHKRIAINPWRHEVLSEGEIDIYNSNNLLQQGYRINSVDRIGDAIGIFCPAGLPRASTFSICMAETDYRYGGEAYLRIDN